MMKKRLSKFIKTKNNVKTKRKARVNIANIVTILAIFLVISLLIIFMQSLHVQSLEGKQTAMVQTYNELSTGFTKLLSDFGNARNENADLDRKNLSLIEQVALYEADVTDYKIKLDECNATITELTAELDELKASSETDRAIIEDYEAQIVKYQEAAAALEDPLALANTPLTSESYLYRGTKWNLIENYTSKKSGTTYTTDRFLVSPSYYYAVYSAGTVSISCYTREYTLIKTLKEDATDGWFVTFDSSTAYISLKYTDTETLFVSTGISASNPETPGKGRAFYVVSKNSPVKLSMSKAVEMLSSGGTVLVLPGTYIDNVSAKSKKLNLIGANRKTCILESYDMDYQNPPLEIAAGVVKNMTIRAVNKNSKQASPVAYGIHSDYDYLGGRTLTISNCTVSSDFHAAIGLGTRKGTVSITNSTLTGKEYGLFFHDSDNETFGGKQTLSITKCKINSSSGKYALAVQGCSTKNCDMTLIFKNNTFSCGSNGTDNPLINLVSGANEEASCWYGFKGFHLDSSSTGNNIAELNSK